MYLNFKCTLYTVAYQQVAQESLGNDISDKEGPIVREENAVPIVVAAVPFE